MADGSPPVPDLQTPRLLLRRLCLDDAPGLHQAYGNAAAMRFWDALPSADLAETEHRIRQSLGADPIWHAAWTMLRRSDDAFVGMVNYHARLAWHHRLAVGWILAPMFWGQGYMIEAMRAVLLHCFDALDTHRVEAEIEPDNIASIRLAERLGFRREGLIRDRLCVAGEYRSLWMYGLLRPEWYHVADNREAV